MCFVWVFEPCYWKLVARTREVQKSQEVLGSGLVLYLWLVPVHPVLRHSGFLLTVPEELCLGNLHTLPGLVTVSFVETWGHLPCFHFPWPSWLLGISAHSRRQGRPKPQGAPHGKFFWVSTFLYILWIECCLALHTLLYPSSSYYL